MFLGGEAEGLPPDEEGVPVEFRLSSYHFDLDPERIAQFPAETRHGARLMVLDRQSGATHRGWIPELLAELGEGDCLVRNVTRVDRARLFGTRVGSGGRVEVLLLEPRPDGSWAAMVRRSKRLQAGCRVQFGEVVAELGEKLPGGLREVRFASPEELALAREQAGELPLPPYIRPAGQDTSRYQTTFARLPGSVAAPTAGLHFEAQDFVDLAARGVDLVDVCLDVGAGTFSPVREGDVRRHQIHGENFLVEPQAARALVRARQQGRRIVSLGTTAMRVLESLPDHPGWEEGCQGRTHLFVLPGYRFRMVDALVTNFHLPCSSLLMLVSAFAGREATLRAYREALGGGFRFFSFGDCMWIR